MLTQQRDGPDGHHMMPILKRQSTYHFVHVVSQPPPGTVDTAWTTPDRITNTCERCRALPLFNHEAMANTRRNCVSLSIGLSKGLKTRHCGVCQFFAAVIGADPGYWNGKRPLADTEFMLGYKIHSALEPPKPFIYAKDSDEDRAIFIDAIGMVFHKSNAGRPHKRVIDPAPVKNWISSCQYDESHKNCHYSLRGKHHDDIVLIDTLGRCLVMATTLYRYVALSYVGGQNRGFETLVANRDSLFVSQSLTKVTTLSAVVQDSMQFCRSIGERYLWVDTICITQDDLHKHKDIANMDTIYGYAFLTLVVPYGKDASYGLPGVSTRPRLATDMLRGVPVSTPTGNYVLRAEAPPFQHILGRTPHESRGWTFQERVLSHRLIYFTNWGSYFSCPAEFRHEMPHFYLEGNGGGHSLMPSNLFPLREVWFLDPPMLLATRAFSYYEELICKYVARHLSYEADRLNAFAGIVGILSKHSSLKFQFGMPTDESLHLSLLWYYTVRSARRAVEVETDTGLKHSLPSWVWGGWRGRDVAESGNVITSLTRNMLQKFGWGSLEAQRIFVPQRIAPLDHPQLLEMLTWVAPSEHFRFASSHNVKDCKVAIRDRNECQCGTVAVPYPAHDFLEQCSKERFEIMLISKWRVKEWVYQKGLIWPMSKTVADWDIRRYNVERPWVMMIMLVKRSGEYVERVGVGCIHEDAWGKAPQTYKLVKLT